MSSETAKEFEGYARDWVKLAREPNTPPEVREQLLQMAREWMHCAMEAENDAISAACAPAAKKASPPSQ